MARIMFPKQNLEKLIKCSSKTVYIYYELKKIITNLNLSWNIL